LDLRGRKVQDAGGDCIMRSFLTYASPYVIRVSKSRRIRWEEHVTRTGTMRNAYNIMV